MQNEDKRVNWEGKPYTFNDEGFSWDFKDSEMIDWYTDETGKIDWNQLEQVRSVRDGYIANEQWDQEPHFTTSRKRGLADLDESFYDYGEGTNKDGYKFQNYMRYPTINKESYMGKKTGEALSPEDKFMKSY